VVIIGIHTPETVDEQNAESVKVKADEAGFAFPVLIDREKANWNAWGNSMWHQMRPRLISPLAPVMRPSSQRASTGRSNFKNNGRDASN